MATSPPSAIPRSAPKGILLVDPFAKFLEDVSDSSEDEQEQEDEEEEDDSQQLGPDNEKKIKEGFLTKKGHNRRNYKQRWFVLTSKSLSYYTSPSMTELKGRIDLTNKGDVVVEKAEGLKFKDKQRENCFIVTVKSKKRSYVIDAKMKSEMEGWIRIIQDVIEGKK